MQVIPMKGFASFLQCRYASAFGSRRPHAVGHSGELS